MVKLFFIFFVICFNISKGAKAQAPRSVVKGTIFDSVSASPLGYASIRIYSSDNKKLVNGNLATDSGYLCH